MNDKVLLMKKTLFALLVCSLSILGCSSSTDGEFADVSQKFVEVLGNEDASELAELFPDMNKRTHEFERYIKNVREKFIKKGLKGYSKMEAQGCRLFEDKESGHGEFVVVAVDNLGKEFLINGIRFEKHEKGISFFLSNDDIDIPLDDFLQPEQLDNGERLIEF